MQEATLHENVIQVEHLSKIFDRVHAVEDVSFAVGQGTTCALLGGNGAGKTTTLSMLLGLLLPTSGSIHILGMDMLQQRYDVLSRMNFTSPYVDLPLRLTVRENLMVYARLYSIARAQQRLEALAEQLDLGDFMNRPCGKLSSGQKTRVALAKSLLNEPEILLLDEPTASMDPDTADRMREYLVSYRQQSGATMLLASHNMQEVERLCDQVFMLREGRLVDEGKPVDLIARYGRQNLEEVFLDIARHPRQVNSGEVA